MRREAGILPSAATGVLCGGAAREDVQLAQVSGAIGNFPGMLAIENNEGYICGGLPYERSLVSKSMNRQR
jgi:hypothetical protein